MRINTASDTPLVTVIMPIRNEAAFIERSLSAILAQTYPPERLEILIVDGMSDDRTLGVIRAMTGADRVKIVSNPRRRQAAAMNTAIAQAAGEIIVRVDGHTVIATDYVEACVTALKETGAANVGGPMNPVGVTPMGKAIAAAGKSVFAVPSAFHVSSEAQITDTVYMGAWWRSIFNKVGDFDEQPIANEDYELNYRIREAGGTIYLTPHIRSVYYGRQTLRELWKQYFRYGVGKVYTLRLHPKSLKLRHLVAPMFLFAVVVGGAASLLNPVLVLLWLSVMTIYGIANLFFSAHVANDVTMMVRLPIVFLSIHLAWGSGFWYAIVQWK